jgi:hypothetical protein
MPDILELDVGLYWWAADRATFNRAGTCPQPASMRWHGRD